MWGPHRWIYAAGLWTVKKGQEKTARKSRNETDDEKARRKTFSLANLREITEKSKADQEWGPRQALDSSHMKIVDQLSFLRWPATPGTPHHSRRMTPWRVPRYPCIYVKLTRNIIKVARPLDGGHVVFRLMMREDWLPPINKREREAQMEGKRDWWGRGGSQRSNNLVGWLVEVETRSFFLLLSVN